MRPVVILAVIVWTVIGIVAVRAIGGGIEGARDQRVAAIEEAMRG